MTLVSAGVSAGFSLNGLLGSGQSDSFAAMQLREVSRLLLTVLIAISVRSYSGIAVPGNHRNDNANIDGVIGALAPRSCEDLWAVCFCSPQRTRGGLAPARAAEVGASSFRKFTMQIRLASLSADADPIWAILEPTIRRRRRTLCRQICRARKRLRIGLALSTRSTPP